jgi:RNA polymerase sigma-70 factor, ECF subfamily
MNRQLADELKATQVALGSIDWEAVYQAELPRVYNFFRYRYGDNALAEDLTAATFERAWRSRTRYQPELAGVSTWLLSIARREAADYFRQAGRQSMISAELSHQTDAHSEPPEAVLERRQDLHRLSHLLDALPERERELIALKYGAGLTNRAIADVTGLSETNVGTLLYRIVRALRAQWENER